MIKIIKAHADKFIFLFLLLFSPLFFYNLGGSSLVDFDEAWWAEVARNILVNKNPFLLFFNGEPSFFHPPFGYSLIALSQLLFGVNEFASRLPSALLGFGAVLLTYLIGKELFAKIVGVAGSLMLLSSVWFIFRARSGNLDAIFVFMFLLTLYLFIKAKNNTRLLYLSAISFSLLFMTKTFIGVSVIVPILVYLLIHWKKLLDIKKIIIAIFIIILILSPWLIANYLNYDFQFIFKLYQNAVKPGKQTYTNLLHFKNSLALQYLHFGILKWFYPSIISFVGAIFFVRKSPNILVIYAWIIPLLAAFIVSRETEIWHLIPLYPAIGLLIGFFLGEFLEFFINLLKELKIKINLEKGQLRSLGYIFILALVLSLSLKQIYGFRSGIGLFDKNQSGLSVVSKAAREIGGPLYLDNENFLPSAVFYSQKKVLLIRILVPPINILKGFVSFGPRPSLLITEKWRLDADKIDTSKYQVLASHEGYLLIKLP